MLAQMLNLFKFPSVHPTTPVGTLVLKTTTNTAVSSAVPEELYEDYMALEQDYARAIWKKNNQRRELRRLNKKLDSMYAGIDQRLNTDQRQAVVAITKATPDQLKQIKKVLGG